jgi:phosphopantetheine adenylyltransferase
MPRVAVYAAYDPTNDGEVAGIGRASVLFDEVVVAIDAQHLPALLEATSRFANVRCAVRSDTIAELVRASGASHVLRTISDATDSAVALADAENDRRALPELVSLFFYADAGKC